MNGAACSGPGAAAAAAPPVDEAAFAAGMRRLAGGVALITTQDATGRHGLVATAVTALSAAPPSLLVCVNRAASAHTALAGAGVFCVNVLATAQEGLAAGFADPARRGERFATGTWLHGMTGAPVLAEALVTFECRVERVVEHGSHSVFMAAIAAIRHGSDAGEPLIYFNRGFRRLA